MRLPDQILARKTDRDRALMAVIEGTDAECFAHGIQITLQDDFDHLRQVNDRLDKLPLTPNFDPRRTAIGPVNGLWMKGVDLSGEVVLTQAARFYDLRDTTLALLHQSLHAFYDDPATQAEEGETCRCDAPATHFITGRVCYHGELWLERRYRSKGLTKALSRLLMALVLLRWQPDYLFGMAQPGICRRGVGARYGYRNMQPHGMIWSVPSTGTLDEWIIWNSRDDLEAAVMRP